MQVETRRMTGDDKPEIVRILHATPEFSPSEVEVAIELIDLYLQQGIDSGYYILVAEADSAPAGYICYGPTPLTDGTWDIYWIAVGAERQNRGIGRRLLAAAEAEIERTDGRLVLIETSSRDDYEKTRGFYRSCSYEQIARVPDFYSPGDDKIVFQKRL